MSTNKKGQKAAPWGEGEPIGRDYPPIPLLEKIAYGVGVLPMNTSVNSIKKLSGPIFNITLGMHPFRVGNVLLDGSRTTQNLAGDGADPISYWARF